MYICNCGRQFEKQSSLNSHARFCKLYVKKERKSIYKVGDNLYKCECGKEFNKAPSLNSHFTQCLIHRKGKLPINGRKLNPVPKGQMNGWANFSDDKTSKIKKESGKTRSAKMKSGEMIPGFKGKHHSEETKKIMRKSTIKYIEDTKGKCSPRYNKNACLYFDNLSKENDWNLIHAENGGEYHIKELGYFIDAYDKEKNIVVEYDERKHYKYDELIEKDRIRQKEIIKLLECEFYRYNEQTNKLVKINAAVV